MLDLCRQWLARKLADERESCAGISLGIEGSARDGYVSATVLSGGNILWESHPRPVHREATPEAMTELGTQIRLAKREAAIWAANWILGVGP